MRCIIQPSSDPSAYLTTEPQLHFLFWHLVIQGKNGGGGVSEGSSLMAPPLSHQTTGPCQLTLLMTQKPSEMHTSQRPTDHLSVHHRRCLSSVFLLLTAALFGIDVQSWGFPGSKLDYSKPIIQMLRMQTWHKNLHISMINGIKILLKY